MYESKTEPGKKFGSAFRGRKFDEYHAGAQPGEENDNSHAESEDHGDDKVNTSTAEKHEPSEAADEVEVTTPSSIVAEHGPANSTHYTHDHVNNKHTVDSSHDGGFQSHSDHGSADEAYEYGSKLSLSPGGEDAWKDTKKRLHPEQQSADSSERQYEAVGSDGM